MTSVPSGAVAGVIRLRRRSGRPPVCAQAAGRRTAYPYWTRSPDTVGVADGATAGGTTGGTAAPAASRPAVPAVAARAASTARDRRCRAGRTGGSTLGGAPADTAPRRPGVPTGGPG